MTTTSNNQSTAKISPRAVWAALLAILGLFPLATGTAILFGGAWTAIITGAVLIAYSMILALPTKNTYWG